jgi:hypothetical protein
MWIQRVINEADGSQTIDDIEVPAAGSAITSDDSSTVVLSLSRNTADQIGSGSLTIAEAMGQSLLKFAGDISSIQAIGQALGHSSNAPHRVQAQGRVQ